MQPMDTLERPLMGVRTFRAINSLLAGISMYGDFFHPDEPRRAECRNYEKRHDRNPSHVAPAPGCKCGWYAWYSPESATAIELNAGIMGVVSAWGDVELHSRGFRSEYMQIEALVLRPPYTARLLGGMAEKYAVPLIDESEIEEFCRERGEILEPSEDGEDPSEAFVQLQVQLRNSFHKMLEDLKPAIERMERAGYLASRSARPTNFQEAIEKKRNKPAFWRDYAGGDVHNG